MSVNKLKINNERFSIRICDICKNMGLTTVGQLSTIISRMKPNAKLYTRQGAYIRVSRIGREISDLSREYDKEIMQQIDALHHLY